jgi:hypothetical protein
MLAHFMLTMCSLSLLSIPTEMTQMDTQPGMNYSDGISIQIINNTAISSLTINVTCKRNIWDILNRIISA